MSPAEEAGWSGASGQNGLGSWNSGCAPVHHGNILYAQDPMRVEPQRSAHLAGKMGHERRYEWTPREFSESLPWSFPSRVTNWVPNPSSGIRMISESTRSFRNGYANSNFGSHVPWVAQALRLCSE